MNKLFLSLMALALSMVAWAVPNGKYHLGKVHIHYVSDSHKFAGGEPFEITSPYNENAWDCEISSDGNGNYTIVNLLGFGETSTGMYNEATGMVTLPAQSVYTSNEDRDTFEYGICGGASGYSAPQDLMNYVDKLGGRVPAKVEDAVLKYDKEFNNLTLVSPILVYTPESSDGYLGNARFMFSELFVEDALVPSGYRPVGNTTLAYKNNGNSIDIHGLDSDNYWFGSTLGDSGFLAAIQVGEADINAKLLNGSFNSEAWKGEAEIWMGGAYIVTQKLKLDPMSVQLSTSDNTLTISNFNNFVAGLQGTVDWDNHQVVFPAQEVDLPELEYVPGVRKGVFCRYDFPKGDPAKADKTGAVVASFNEDNVLTIDGWCIIGTDDLSCVVSGDAVVLSVDTPAEGKPVICNNGASYSGVRFESLVTQQGGMARICYTLTNTTSEDVTFSLGTYADISIAFSPSSPFFCLKDHNNETYGLQLGNRKQYKACVLFGAGITGVTPCDDFWFGSSSTNRNPTEMVGNYIPGNRYMEDGANCDGLGMCWKNRTLKAGQTREFSYLVNVGSNVICPVVTHEITPSDPSLWNDMSFPSRLNIKGSYESPAGISGKLQYSVEDDKEWKDFDLSVSSGQDFELGLDAVFNPENKEHSIRLRAVDNYGNTTELPEMKIRDIRYISIHERDTRKDYNYGEPIFINRCVTDFPKEQFVICDYKDNVDAGTAKCKIAGFFPYSIGEYPLTFEIVPIVFEGDVVIDQHDFVYNGNEQKAPWHFSSERLANTVEGRDYKEEYKNCIYPGGATLTITGMGNFKGTRSVSYVIDKAPLTEDLYHIELPLEEEVLYDGNEHGVTVTTEEGVGVVEITSESFEIAYDSKGNPFEEHYKVYGNPISGGEYDIYVEIREGKYYYGKEKEKVASIIIYKLDRAEYNALKRVNNQLADQGINLGWDFTYEQRAVPSFPRLSFSKGRLVALDLSNLGMQSIPADLYSFPLLETLDLSHNNLKGNVTDIVNKIPSLTSLNVPHNGFSDIYPTLPERLVDLDFSNQKIDKVVDLDLSDYDFEKFISQVPTITLYDFASNSYEPVVDILCTTSQADEFDYNDWDKFALSCQISEEGFNAVCRYGKNIFKDQNGALFKVFPQVEGNHTYTMRVYFSEGDANFDGVVDVLDLQQTIFYIVNFIGGSLFNHTAADTFTDGIINIQDVVCTVDILLERNAENSNGEQLRANGQVSKVRTNNSKDLNLSDDFNAQACVFVENGYVYLYSEREVAALDILLDDKTVGVEWYLHNFGMTQATNEGHLIGYSLSGKTLPVGTSLIGRVTDDCGIGDCVLADYQANRIPVSLTKNTTSIEGVINIGSGDFINASDFEDCRVYDLSGHRLNHIQNGSVNIVVDGNGARKVLNKNKLP